MQQCRERSRLSDMLSRTVPPQILTVSQSVSRTGYSVRVLGARCSLLHWLGARCGLLTMEKTRSRGEEVDNVFATMNMCEHIDTLLECLME